MPAQTDLSKRIDDMIRTFPLKPTPEMAFCKLLGIMQIINERMDKIELEYAVEAKQKTTKPQ